MASTPEGVYVAAPRGNLAAPGLMPLVGTLNQKKGLILVMFRFKGPGISFGKE